MPGLRAEPHPATTAGAGTDAVSEATATAWGRELLALGIVALVFLVPLRGLLRAQGPPMEEGFMLVFPERVVKGDIPN